jgi:hypothetical protein
VIILSTVTLPEWFWTVYYLFLLLTLATTIISIIKKRYIKMSLLTICLTLTIPIISLINSIGRLEGLNEFQHLIKELQNAAVWSLYVSLGYIALVVWWVLFISTILKRNVNKNT